ncbi:MAG: 30S ribosomal protein S15 [Saprospiraceae bacterium]|nr:30S ribosomal protein S15 [Saprospiraceae bacterium]MBK8153195.1 30S ribosomal protein S15 [Saprospiraceae bacterium]MBK9377170.1 30S ribosomal protein S15 [Saprospiraceae bacterium]MBL0261430.1 30S ribosomal protein S15 [Saprospiraceae bacterium]MBX7163331.1 30S ribosomal protein S15 [Saprospiraceae bacterium]
MSSYLSKEKVSDIFKQYGGSASNTGSTEGQIALFTFRIQALSEHLRSNKKDHSCRRSLLHLVGKRKQLLQYLHHKDLDRYKKVLDQLGLRK